MAAYPYSGKWTNKRYATKASTAYTANNVVYTDGTNVLHMVATGEDCLGILQEAKASSDTSTSKITVRVPADSSATMVIDVGTGTPTAAFEGRLCDPDDSNPSTQVDVSTTTESTYRIEKFISSSKVVVSLSPTKR